MCAHCVAWLQQNLERELKQLQLEEKMYSAAITVRDGSACYVSSSYNT